MDTSSINIVTILKEIVIAFQTIEDDEITEPPPSPTIKNHQKVFYVVLCLFSLCVILYISNEL
jgi:hypothetical protein